MHNFYISPCYHNIYNYLKMVLITNTCVSSTIKNRKPPGKIALKFLHGSFKIRVQCSKAMTSGDGWHQGCVYASVCVHVCLCLSLMEAAQI